MVTGEGMHVGDDTGIGYQKDGSDFDHKAKRESRLRAGARIEWRMSIEEGGAENAVGDGGREESDSMDGGSGKSTASTNAFKFASFSFSASSAMAGLSGMGALFLQRAGFGAMLSPFSNALSISSCLTATNRRFPISLWKLSKPQCSTNATSMSAGRKLEPDRVAYPIVAFEHQHCHEYLVRCVLLWVIDGAFGQR